MHEEHVNYGSPYDFTAKITCSECLDILWAKRYALCQKYGWSEWPDALNTGRDYLPRRDNGTV